MDGIQCMDGTNDKAYVIGDKGVTMRGGRGHKFHEDRVPQGRSTSIIGRSISRTEYRKDGVLQKWSCARMEYRKHRTSSSTARTGRSTARKKLLPLPNTPWIRSTSGATVGRGIMMKCKNDGE